MPRRSKTQPELFGSRQEMRLEYTYIFEKFPFHIDNSIKHSISQLCFSPTELLKSIGQLLPSLHMHYTFGETAQLQKPSLLKSLNSHVLLGLMKAEIRLRRWLGLIRWHRLECAVTSSHDASVNTVNPHSAVSTALLKMENPVELTDPLVYLVTEYEEQETRQSREVWP